MNKKTMLIGLGVLAVAGIGYYMWKKKNETKLGACGCSGADGQDEGYVAGWENEPKSDYTAGWEKDKETPKPCADGYNATLDPIKGTICTLPPKNITRPLTTNYSNATSGGKKKTNRCPAGYYYDNGKCRSTKSLSTSGTH
jgi:hypothetical protein